MSRIILTIAALLTLSTVALPATAQEKTLVLLTETEVGSDGETTESFWWSASSEPAWTTTDEALRRRGAAFAPRGLERISRIYRRPNLTDANAAALAELFGAQTALVGEVRREALDVTPLGDTAIRVSIDARLVEPGAEGTVLRQTYTIERLARGAPEVAVKLATDQAAASLMGLVSATLERKIGPVGVAADELTITLHDVPTLEAWRLIRTRLGQREGVDDVSVVWLAEGIIAVAINAKTGETEDTIQRIARDLQNEVFETFELTAAPEESGAGTVAVRVRSVMNR